MENETPMTGRMPLDELRRRLETLAPWDIDYARVLADATGYLDDYSRCTTVEETESGERAVLGGLTALEYAARQTSQLEDAEARLEGALEAVHALRTLAGEAGAQADLPRMQSAVLAVRQHLTRLAKALTHRREIGAVAIGLPAPGAVQRQVEREEIR
jgi:hypothetical protein